VRFFANHKLFALGNRPDWRTVTGGSQQYVRRLAADGRFTARLSSAVARIERSPVDAEVVLAGGERESYDAIVLATHADEALALLARPTARERDLLSPFKTSANRVFLHRQASLMPRRRRFWSAWNYRGADAGHDKRLAVTYWMNALQKLDTPTQHFVSLNPQEDPAPHLVDGVWDYRHPLFNTETLAAQKDLWSLQGVNRTWFCGAWFGSGFHEDGIQAGLAVAEQLGGLSRPWTVPDPSGRIHVTPVAHPLQVAFGTAAE
jgi:predicted NAD/FAD-binding protein